MLEQQVKRMLADKRSNAMIANFAEQWLFLRNLKTSAPDLQEFPDFDDNLRQRHEAGDDAVLRQHHARGPQRVGSAERRLHVRE